MEHPQAMSSQVEDALDVGPDAAAGALLHFGICKVRSKQESLPPTAVIVRLALFIYVHRICDSYANPLCRSGTTQC